MQILITAAKRVSWERNASSFPAYWALDEANLERYADYMRTMAGSTQFIVITHHRATMEEADVLYGVTMQEKGVTTVLNVDLDEAERSIAVESRR